MARMHISRLLSGGLYAGALFWAPGHFHLPQVFGIALAMLLPLLLIWFPQESNELALGTLQKNGIARSPVPAWVIGAAGWLLFLLLPPLAGLTVGH